MQEEISFGNWLRKQRRALDLPRQAFADQVGCAEVTLRRIEAGTLKPSKELATILLEKLGIPETERLQWISFARGLSGFPSQSPSSPSKSNSNLPAPLTTFIGREKEQLDVIRLLAKHRLVSLTGPGGVGKTRLSLKVGEQVLGDYADGVWLVELAPILDPLLVPRTTSIAIGLRHEPQRPVVDMLSDYLREREILIILDNCEHLLDACAQLADTLLKRCPHLKVLANSREALGILGEAMYLVTSLELPDMQQLLEKFRDYESVRLFEERAQLARMEFSLTLENSSSVAKICTHLDGIPLAIELAAARVGTFSTEQIEERLRESFRLLTTGNRTAMPRHQTLQAAIDWSYDLLSPAEQTLFRQLSVFVDGWTLQAAESICSDANINPNAILSVLTRLINKSLVIMDDAQGETRYHMLETIRQYANEKLGKSGEKDVLRDKHLAYFVKLVEQAEPELYCSNQVFWLTKLDDELANLRLALEWALATDSASGLRLASIPWRFWQRRDYLQEAGGWLNQLLERYPKSDSLRAQALAVYCQCIMVYGNFLEARKFAEQSLQLARALSDRQNEALSLLFLGGTFVFQGSIHEGIPFLEESLTLYRTLGDKIGQATALGWLAAKHDDLEYSKSLVLESLNLHRDLGNLAGIADCLTDLASQAILGGDFSSPVPWLEEARTLFQKLGNRSDEADVLTNFGVIAYWQGNYEQASTCFEKSLALYGKVGVWWSSWSHFRLALTFLRQGDIVRAREKFEISLQQFQKYDILIGLIYTIEGLASLNVNQGQPERATRLFAWADAMRERISDHRPPVEQNSLERDLVRIRSHLDDAAFENAYRTGRTMTMEQAIALGREE